MVLLKGEQCDFPGGGGGGVYYLSKMHCCESGMINSGSGLKDYYAYFGESKRRINQLVVSLKKELFTELLWTITVKSF